MQSSELTLRSQEQLKTCKWRKLLLCGTQELSKDTSEEQWKAQHTSIQDKGSQNFFHRHWKISKQQTLEAGPETQTNIKAEIQMDGIVSKGWPTNYCLRKKIPLLEILYLQWKVAISIPLAHLRETGILLIFTFSVYIQMILFFFLNVLNMFYLKALSSSFSSIMQDALPQAKLKVSESKICFAIQEVFINWNLLGNILCRSF